MRHNSIPVATGVLLAFFAIAAEGQTAAPPHQRPVSVKAGGPARLSDAEIEATIRLKLAKSKIGADKFRFKVQGGVATIEGNTSVIQHKGAATRMAKTAGAAAVNNHIQISDEAKEKAAENLESGRRRAQVKRSDSIKRGDARSDPTAAPQPAAAANAPVRARIVPKAPPSAVQKQ